MAEEPLEGRPPQEWRPFWPALTPNQIAIGVSIALFLLTFSVYWFSGPQETFYNQPIRLADAMLHGRLYIANAEELRDYLEFAPYKGRYYQVEPPMSAILLLPGVMLYGLAFNQAFASVVVGAFTAPAVYLVVRGFVRKTTDQIWLVMLFAFGTIYWWIAVTGSVWQFGHTIAVLFLFLAIHQTIVSRRPLMAGAFLGAAFLARGPILLSLPFFVIMFSDQWLRPAGVVEQSLLRRLDLRPLLRLAAGLAPFVILDMGYNYLAFDTPLPVAHDHYFDQFPPTEPLLLDGVFNVKYITRHLPSLLINLPTFSTEAPYVVPYSNGIAIWASTPAFLLAFLAGAGRPRLVQLQLVLVAFAILVLAASAEGQPFPQLKLQGNLEYYPFLFLMGSSLAIASRDKMAIACWAAILLTAFLIFSYAISAGLTSFADRFALDYYPFIFLLVIRAVGRELRWYHKALIVASIGVNLWGVLWIYQFEPNHLLDLKWTPW